VEDGADELVIEPSGAIRPAGADAERRLKQHAGRYRLVVDAPGLVILRESANAAPGRASTHVAMAGELLTRTSVLEVVNIIATAGWRGELHVLDGISKRVLAIDQGALKSANSDDPDDRLGQVIYRHGVVSRTQLDELLAAVSREKRLGQLLLERGILTQEQLFTQLKRQIEQIFHNALLTHSGHYVFLVPDDDAEPPVHSVHLPITQLLMEGVQRIDEMALFREKIPNDDLRPIVQPRATRLTLDENAQLVMQYADGQRTVEDISRESGLGQFMTVKAIYGMMQQGAIVLKPKKALDVEAVTKLVRSFNDVLRDIFMAVATYGGIDQTRSTLEAWIHGSGYSTIFGDVEEDGSIDLPRVLDALAHTEAENPVEALHQALHELAAFALFAATTTLPRDQELTLSRDVNTRLKRIRM
jgi:hypothetical protein